MDALLEKRCKEALRAYVAGDGAEPDALAAFKGVPLDERAALVSRHRGELSRIDGARLLILESMLLPLDHRQG